MSPQMCADCGSELAPGQRFCPGCGTPVAAAPTEAVAAPPPKKTPRRGLWLLLVGGGGLVLLACICIAVFGGGALLLDTGVGPWAAPRQDYVAPVATPRPAYEATGVAPLATPSRDYEAGEYFIEHIGQNFRGFRAIYQHQTFSDFGAEVQVRFETDVESVRGGLVWRFQDKDNYYYFNIQNTGRYVLTKIVDGEWQNLIPATASPHINTGIATNDLKVVASADLIRMYVNDQRLADFTDSSFREGKIGLRAEVVTESPITTRVFFDNLLIYDFTAATKLYEDDFDDPESGWAAAETETYRVGYVSASEAVEASEPVEIVSERELTPDEFFQAVEGDESFADVYALAAEQGYTEPGEASEAIASDGSEVQAILLSSPEGDNIGVFRIGQPGLTNSLLARPERGGEALVLYDREGGVEISEEGFSIFDAAGNPIAETPLQEGRRTAALGAWANDRGCGGMWHDLNHCLGETYIGWDSGIGVWSGCAVGVLTFGAGILAGEVSGGLTAAGGFLAFVALCPPLKICAEPMRTDDPPIVTFAHREVLDRVCEECSDIGGEAIWTSQKVRVHYKVDDDRMLVLIEERAVEVCGTETPRVRVEDYCLDETFTTDFDPVPAGDLVAADLQACADGEECVQVSDDKAECTRVEDPEPPGPSEPPPEPPVPPGPTGPPVITIWLGGRERDGVLVPSDYPCAWLEWEVQNATTVHLAGEPVGATGESEWCIGEAFQEATYTFIAEGPGGRVEKEFTVEKFFVQR